MFKGTLNRLLKPNFRTKLTLSIFGLILLALGGGTISFLNIYKQDKVLSLFETEFSGASQAGSRIASLIMFSESLNPQDLRKQSNILLIIENTCTDAKSYSSGYLENSFLEVNLDSKFWAQLPSVQKACATLREAKVKNTSLLNGGPRMAVPYLLLFIPTSLDDGRLVVVSMDGIGSPSGTSLSLIIDATGKVLWSDESEAHVNEVLLNAKLDEATLKKISSESILHNIPGTIKSGSDSLISFAPLLSQNWIFASLTRESIALEPFYFVIKQTLLLALGFLSICLLAGKAIAESLTKPLTEIRGAAERLGSGDLSSRFEVTNDDEELNVVRKTFNKMADQINGLIQESKQQAQIESEMELVQQVQAMFIPKKSLNINGFNLHGSVKMAQKCGGDWWGFIEITQQGKTPQLLLLIGDVTGHGVSSGLLTASAQGALSLLKSWIEMDPSMGSDPRVALNLFNKAIHYSAGGALNMSMFAAVIDREKEQIHWSNAGHNPPYVLKKKRGQKTEVEIKSLSSGSPVLGENPNFLYQDSFTLDCSGDDYKLFLYTDGLFDCIRDEKSLFSRRSLLHLFKKHGSIGASELMAKVWAERDLSTQGLPEQDDVTIVICEPKVIT